MNNDLIGLWDQGCRPKVNSAVPNTRRDARFHTLNGPPTNVSLSRPDQSCPEALEVLKSEGLGFVGHVGGGDTCSKPPTIVPGPNSEMMQLITAFTEGMKLIARTMNEHQVIASERQRTLMQEQRSAIKQMVESVASIKPPEYHFKSVPRCNGTGPDLENWLARIGRVQADHNIDDKLVIREAGAKLDGLAATWHDRVGKYFDTWSTWAERFREAFALRLSAQQWFYAVEMRRQQPNEQASVYVLDKLKFLKQCPYPMSEEDFVPFLVCGLRNQGHLAALSRNPPRTINALMQELNSLEAFQPLPYSFANTNQARPSYNTRTEDTSYNTNYRLPSQPTFGPPHSAPHGVQSNVRPRDSVIYFQPKCFFFIIKGHLMYTREKLTQLLLLTWTWIATA